MDNRKVIGAKKKEYNGIIFDSMLELNTYKLLEKENFEFTYNETTIVLADKFRLDNINFYNSTRTRKFSQALTKDGKKAVIGEMTFTPDFILGNEDTVIIIETKGWANDVYPYKRKLFFNSIKDSNSTIYYFEPKNLREVKDSITIIKELLNEGKI